MKLLSERKEAQKFGERSEIWLGCQRDNLRALSKEVGTLTCDSVVKAFSNGNWMCAYRALLWALEFQIIEQKFILYVEDGARGWSVKLKMRLGRRS